MNISDICRVIDLLPVQGLFCSLPGAQDICGIVYSCLMPNILQIYNIVLLLYKYFRKAKNLKIFPFSIYM